MLRIVVQLVMLACCSWGGALAWPRAVVVADWNIRVVDAITGNPVAGMQVEARSKVLAEAGYLIRAITAADGRATLHHPDGFAEIESVIALGNDAYHYTSRSEAPGSGTTMLYVLPYSAFWKSSMISATVGTGSSPLTWTSTMDGPSGLVPFLVEVSVPSNVLPKDCQIWAAARPIYQGVNNGFGPDEVPAHFGQMHIELRTADGSEVVTAALKDPGVQISLTPWWFPAAYFPINDNVVVRQLNTSSLDWDTMSSKGSFVTATGRVSFSLRSFSCVDLSAERYGNALRGNPGQQTNPPTPTPPTEDLPTVEWEDCLRLLDPAVMVPIVCCVYQTSGSKTVTKGSTFTASESSVDEVTNGFNISLVELDKLIGKLNIGSQNKVTKTQSASFETTAQESDSITVVQGSTLTSCTCQTGTARLCGLTKKATFKKAGCPDVQFYAYRGLGTAYCLKYVECAPGCNEPGPHSTQVVSPPGQKICVDAWTDCKD